MTLAALPILDVWAALGGGKLRGNRGRAFWRGGDGWNIALDAEKNAWFDHRDVRGGGVLDLVQLVLGCDRAAVLRWLEQNCGLDSRGPLTATERVARAQAPALAQRLADFAGGLRVAVHRQLDLAQLLGFDPGLVRNWHEQAHLLSIATPTQIAELWRMTPEQREAVERIGREDREHAEAIAHAVIDLLAVSQESRRAA